MEIYNEFNVGDKVFDDLTRKVVTVIGISYTNGITNNKCCDSCHTIGYWVDNNYCGGGRHPWELSKLQKE